MCPFEYVVFWLATAAAAAAATASTDNSTAVQTLVQTPSGPIYTENRTDSGIAVYKGIPFAQPPVGDLRWRSPQAMDAWTSPLNATEVRYHCYFFSKGPFDPPSEPSEDCLYLNVWTGAVGGSGRNTTTITTTNSNSSSSSSLLPVMVWIHGGGFETDSATSTRYDGTYFAERDVVLVSLNYRLGNFGFLARPDLDGEEEGEEDATSGNYGIQDMLAALRWVKANIAAFGGDVDRITVFGESAGAHALGILIASPLSEGLFQQAIMESGGWWDSTHGSLSTAAEARARGVAWGDSLLAPTPALLRQLPASVVVNSSAWDVLTDPSKTAFSPSIDGYVVPAAPAAAFAAGAQANVSLMAGWNAREDTIFQTFALPHASRAVFDAARDAFFFFNRTGLGLSDVQEEAASFYPAGDGDDTDDEEAEAMASAYLLVADLVIAQQTWEAAYHQSSRLGAPTYVYHFTYTSAYNPVAGHASELEFVFGTFAPEVELAGEAGVYSATPDAGDRALGAAVMAYWTNFAKSGDPNGPAAVPAQWPRYDASANMLLELGNTIGPAENSEFSRFDFIRSLRVDGVLPAKWRTSPAGTLAGFLTAYLSDTWGPINGTIIGEVLDEYNLTAVSELTGVFY
ncbi:Carboxylesterase [Xylariaceae sp. FL0804]|nr:Carboxylesterase [Xylariaceae sp. FL0804]